MDVSSFLPFHSSLSSSLSSEGAAGQMPVVSSTLADATEKRPLQAVAGRQTTPSAGRNAVAQPAQALRPMRGAAYAAETAPGDLPSAQPNSSLEDLKRKQDELARKEQDLKALENDLNGRLEQMQDLELRLKVMLKDADAAKDTKYQHLVDVLSNMKARQAAAVLETLDEKIAVRVLASMRGRQAGEILTYVSSEKAARLAESLARMQMPLQ